jgi:hypothetical protein
MIIDLIKKGKTRFVGKLKNLFSKKKQEESASEYSIPVTTISGLTSPASVNALSNAQMLTTIASTNMTTTTAWVEDFLYGNKNVIDFNKSIGMISIDCKKSINIDNNLSVHLQRMLSINIQQLNRHQNPFLTGSSVIPDDLYDETKPLLFTLSASYYDDNISKSSEHMMVKLGYALEQVKQLEHDITEAIDFFADTMVGNGELAEACEKADEMERSQNQLKEEKEQ